MEKKTLQIIENETKKLLDLLKVEAQVEVQAAEEAININLKTEDSGILIGYHGQTLASCQLILNLIVYKKLGQWVRINFDVGDWWQKREESLKSMALETAQRVEASGEAAILPYLSAAERRLVHLALQDHPGVTTESQGEEGNRQLVIKPKA